MLLVRTCKTCDNMHTIKGSTKHTRISWLQDSIVRLRHVRLTPIILNAEPNITNNIPHQLKLQTWEQVTIRRVLRFHNLVQRAESTREIKSSLLSIKTDNTLLHRPSVQHSDPFTWKTSSCDSYNRKAPRKKRQEVASIPSSIGTAGPTSTIDHPGLISFKPSKIRIFLNHSDQLEREMYARARQLNCYEK